MFNDMIEVGVSFILLGLVLRHIAGQLRTLKGGEP
jgi:hypothetical protein